MKATGIIRRMDDLGRVVIPKEIRRTVGIREGEPLKSSLMAEIRSASASIKPICVGMLIA